MSVPTLPLSSSLPVGRSSSAFNELRSCSGSRKARVLYDYDAAGSSELSLLADEVGDGILAHGQQVTIMVGGECDNFRSSQVKWKSVEV